MTGRGQSQNPVDESLGSRGVTCLEVLVYKCLWISGEISAICGVWIPMWPSDLDPPPRTSLGSERSRLPCGDSPWTRCPVHLCPTIPTRLTGYLVGTSCGGGKRGWDGAPPPPCVHVPVLQLGSPLSPFRHSFIPQSRLDLTLRARRHQRWERVSYQVCV